MKKKGFTLVELLAVIAILAILAIIALPNVMGLFRDSKKKSFDNDVKSIFRAANQQYAIDALATGESAVYSNLATTATGCTGAKALSMEGRINSMQYVVKISNGKVTFINVSDGTYASKTTGDDIKVTGLTAATDNTTKVTTCN